MKHVVLLFLVLSSAGYSQSNLNMYADTLHAPFIYGVASGDPTGTSVQLWTYAGPSTEGQDITWLVATDSLFTNVVASGSEVCTSTNTYTIKPIATGLQPYTDYFYRFYAPGNSLSVTGRTRTASVNPNQQVNFGVVSCSSIFSGYFNAYRHMAKDASIDAIIHLGDYIYDFVDPDEQIRITDPFPTQPTNIDEWRERHMYYLLDPDLRLARQMHPWIQTWDNHDFKQSILLGERAFYEFTPTTPPDPNDINKIYRKLSWGIADIFMIDMQSYDDIDEISPGNLSVLGFEQYNWLTSGLAASTAKWKIVGTPKMVTYWSIQGLENLLGTNTAVLFENAWDGYALEREKMLKYIDSLNIDNVVFVSGDSHFSQLADLPLDAQDDLVYFPETGAGSIAVEFLPTSVSRGNFDEMGYDASLQPVIVEYIDIVNPNHVYTELLQHGYGLLNVKADSSVAQYVYCPILAQTDDTLNAWTQVVMDGENHWKRKPKTTTGLAEEKAEKVIIYPNPAQSELWMRLPLNGVYTTLDVYNGTGQKVQSQPVNGSLVKVNSEALPAGIYYLVVNGGKPLQGRFVKQ
jgi:alkaline phosphatase D